MRHRLTLLALIFGGLSCSVTENGSIALIYGDDDPFTEATAPAPSSILIGEVTVDGAEGGSSGDAATTLAEGPYEAGTTLSLPGQDAVDVDILQATLFDSTHSPIIFGQTIPVQLEGIQGSTYGIFVQRKGQFARLPSPFSAGTVPALPLALAIENQYIVIADGSGNPSATTAPIFDMSAWLFEETSAGLPCAPLSIAPLGGTLILVVCETSTLLSDSGCVATDTSGLVGCGYDLSTIVATQVVAVPISPPGSTECSGWEGGVGGSTGSAPNGDSFIVGGTRPATSGRGPTSCVLRIGNFETTDDAGTFPAPQAMGSFSVARQGAAAAWSSNYGLVIAGGNLSSSDPPVEYLGMTADADAGTLPVSTVAHGYTVADLAQGSGAAIFDTDSTLVLAGGTLPDKSLAGVRVYTLLCDGNCEVAAGDAGSEAGMEAGADAGPKAGAEAGADAALDAGIEGDAADAGAIVTLALANAQGFTVSASSALFVGPGPASAGGVTQAFLVSMSNSGSSVKSLAAVPLKVTNRKSTTALWSPVGSVVVIGGGTTMESFIP